MSFFILPAFFNSTPSLIPEDPEGKLSEVLAKSFLVGTLTVGLERPRVSGHDCGSPRRCAVLCPAQASSPAWVLQRRRGAAGLEIHALTRYWPTSATCLAR